MALITPFAILSFPTLFTPRPKVYGGEPQYSCTLLFSPEMQQTEAFKAMKAAAHEVFVARFGDKAKPSGAYSNPFRDAAEKDYQGYEEGWVFISPSTKKKPDVIDADLQQILVPDDIWAGQLVRGYVNPYAYDRGGNRGVSFGLNGIQLVNANMPRLDGRLSAAKAFDDGLVGGKVHEDADAPF